MFICSKFYLHNGKRHAAFPVNTCWNLKRNQITKLLNSTRQMGIGRSNEIKKCKVKGRFNDTSFKYSSTCLYVAYLTSRVYPQTTRAWRDRSGRNGEEEVNARTQPPPHTYYHKIFIVQADNQRPITATVAASHVSSTGRTYNNCFLHVVYTFPTGPTNDSNSSKWSSITRPLRSE